MVNGEKTEEGNHNELMERFPDGTYAEFCRKQASSEAQQAEEPAEDPDEVQKAPETATGGLKRARTKTIKDGLGRTKTLVLNAEVTDKLDEADKADEAREKAIEEMLKPLRAQSDFAKVMRYNHPKILIAPALLAVAICGSTQPLFGWIFSKVMQTMTIPVKSLKFVYKDKWAEKLEDEIVELVIYTCGIAAAMFFGIVGKSYIFGYLGENVTMKIRQLLYGSIL